MSVAIACLVLAIVVTTLLSIWLDRHWSKRVWFVHEERHELINQRLDILTERVSRLVEAEAARKEAE